MVQIMTGDSTMPTSDSSAPPSPYLTPEELSSDRPHGHTVAPLEWARRRMMATGQWNDSQAMGRRWAIGCVALEVTQRCNLDCTLCYLSESAEAVKDVPLVELYRRIDAIFELYGPGTDVQVTGGDPTLRRRDELAAIVRRIREKGMRPALFTNGIRATRELLTELAAAGLVDVAFHVDMTQRRRGYRSESELNALRRDYIERARGLKLAVIFNTTVFAGNFEDVPAIAAFLAANSDVVSFASFQLQADTGRGIERGRPSFISQQSVAGAICRGIGAELSFGFPGSGHARCNKYAMALICNGRAYDFYEDRAFLTRMLQATAGLSFDRQDRRKALATMAAWALGHPWVIGPGLRWLARRAWRMRRDLIAARGKVTKISFFIHNFMDACGLERDRIEACAFMVATAEGPLSMCLHNARRDDFLLRPVPMSADQEKRFWNPLTGRFQPSPQRTEIPTLPLRRQKGRARLGRGPINPD
jgi:7,8-dihydro-6-hydroxymethylpterin dimethyltransferase